MIDSRFLYVFASLDVRIVKLSNYLNSIDFKGMHEASELIIQYRRCISDILFNKILSLSQVKSVEGSMMNNSKLLKSPLIMFNEKGIPIYSINVKKKCTYIQKVSDYNIGLSFVPPLK